MFKNLKGILIKAIIIVLLVVIIILLEVAKKDVNFAENMTRTVARGYGQGASYISSLVPFLSLTEVLFAFLFFVGILLLILAIIDFVKITPFKAANKILTIPLIALTVVVLYNFSCEAAYNRKEIPLPYYQD